jgi:hypothetical protein
LSNTAKRLGRSGETTQRIVDAYAANPDATMRQVAALVGTTVDYVRCIRHRRRADIPRKAGGKKHHGIPA